MEGKLLSLLMTLVLASSAQAGSVSVSAITTGSLHTCSLLSTGKISCWGAKGTTGNGTNKNTNFPVLIPGYSDITNIQVSGISF